MRTRIATAFFAALLAGCASLHTSLLGEIMVAYGFKPLEEAWWHFTLANEPYLDTYFDFPVRE